MEEEGGEEEKDCEEGETEAGSFEKKETTVSILGATQESQDSTLT